MSVDKVTTEQRKGIHDRARTIGYNEGLRSGVNQLASIVGPEIGKVSLWALDIVIETKDDYPSQLVRFRKVDWANLGAETLEDLSSLSREELAHTQPSQIEGEIFATAVTDALKVFNIES